MNPKILFSAIALLCSAMGAMGQVTNLPQPNLSDTASLKYALENRCSTRQYDATKELSEQEISNILWAGWGYNRAEKRTAPSAIDRQEITLYICTQQGVFAYDAKNNKLETISKKNTGLRAKKCCLSGMGQTTKQCICLRLELFA